MTFTKPNDPAAGVNPASYAAQAEPDKVDWDIVSAGSAGTGVVSGCAVTAQGTPNMTVAVAAGTVAVLSAQAAVAAGNVTVTAADATNPRIDLIVSSSAGVKSCVAGTAAAVPCMPNVPAASVALAEIYVPAGATTITSAQIRDCRVQIATNGDTAWTFPTLSNGWSNFGAPWITVRYRKLGSGVVIVEGLLTNAGSTTAVAFTLPVGYRPAGQFEVPSSSAATTTLIKADGTVQLAATGTLLGLDAVNFYADN